MKMETLGTNAPDTNEKKRLGACLKDFREEQDLNQEQLARILGCTAQYISDVERGKYSLSLGKYLKLCEQFGVASDRLLFGKNEQYSEFDIRNRIMKKIDGLNMKQVEFLEEQINLMKKVLQ